MMSGVRALVDEIESDFVDYREAEGALYPVFQAKRQVVAQVVEAELRCWCRKVMSQAYAHAFSCGLWAFLITPTDSPRSDTPDPSSPRRAARGTRHRDDVHALGR